MKTKIKTINLNFSIFLVAALTLLVLKLTAYPAISWWIIFVVGFFPFLFSLSLIALVAFAFVPVFLLLILYESIKNKKR